MEDGDNLAAKKAQCTKKMPNPFKEKKLRSAGKVNREMKKSVVTLPENVDVVKGKRGERMKDGLKNDNQAMEDATLLAVIDSQVSSTVAGEAKGKKESQKKTQLVSKAAPEAEHGKDKTSGTQTPAEMGCGRKLKEPVKDKVPAAEANGDSQPKADEVTRGQGKARTMVIEDVNENEQGPTAVKPNKESTSPVVVAKKKRRGRPSKAGTVENISKASQVAKAAPAKKVETDDAPQVSKVAVSLSQLPAKKGSRKKPQEPVKDKVPAVGADGVSEPKAAEVVEVTRGQGKARTIVIEDIEENAQIAEEIATKGKNEQGPTAVKPKHKETLEETEPTSPVVVAKKKRRGRPSKAGTVENIGKASQVAKAAPAKKVETDDALAEEASGLLKVRFNFPNKTPSKPPTTISDQVKAAPVAENPIEVLLVYCRVLPLELPTDDVCVKVVNGTLVQLIDKKEDPSQSMEVTCYRFNEVFDQSRSEVHISQCVALPLLCDVLNGKSVLLFENCKVEDGVIPRCFDIIFDSIGKLQTPRGVFKPDGKNGFDIQNEVNAYYDSRTPSGMRAENEEPRVQDKSQVFAVFVTFVEVNDKEIIDLLDDPGKQMEPKTLREDQQHMYVHGVTVVEVKSTVEALEVFAKGRAHWASSGGHSVFNIRVVQAPRQHAALKDIPVTVGQFSLVYLAGSKTNRMDSLTTLSSLFNTLRENKWKNTATFVHQLHNDSMLNHVFQNYFEGVVKVAMMASINPGENHFYENLLVMRCAEKWTGDIDGVDYIIVVNDCVNEPDEENQSQKKKKKARLAAIESRLKARKQMEHNMELQKCLKDEILFMNEAFSLCPMDMLRNVKIPLERAVMLTWKDPSTQGSPPARSATRKDPQDQRNTRERNNEAVRKSREKQKKHELSQMKHIEELEDSLVSLRNLAEGISPDIRSHLEMLFSI